MELTGKDAVRALFFQRLDQAGLKRPKACKSATDFEAVRRRLVDFLAYLSPISIETLADQVLMAAEGKARDQMPNEIIIRQMALALEVRPPEEAPIVTGWFASVEGPRALAAGNAVEMLRLLRKKRCQLMPHHRTMIADDAARNARARQIIAERKRDGIDRPEDQAWLEEYEADLRTVQDLIARGEARRKARELGEAEACR